MAAVTRREYAGGAAATTLSSAINNSTLTIPIASGTGWPTGAQGPFYIVIGRGTATEEKILCDSRSGDTITANASGRGADDTSAASHDSGATVEHVWSAQDADDVNKIAAALTTKGDLLGFSTEPVRRAVGANDTMLVADSAEGTGVDWKTPTEVVTILQAQILAQLEGESSGLPLAAVKTADETVNNSTTLQNDDHLVVVLEANSYYAFTGGFDLDASGGTVSGKVAFTVPSGATVVWQSDGEGISVTGSGTGEQIGTGGFRRMMPVTGIVYTAATAGNLQAQWAQDSAEAADLVMKKGSWLRAEKLA